jgi:hypothetical protein
VVDFSDGVFRIVVRKRKMQLAIKEERRMYMAERDERIKFEGRMCDILVGK